MPFSHLGLHADLLRGVRELGFTRPTPIQEQAIPPALAGRDVMAGAMTGSGKTAAFLLPILHRLAAKPRGTTRALVLTPTRELAAQIAEHLEALALHTPLSGAAVFGGVGMGPQEHAFRKGVDVLIATPGRLLDHFRFPYARLHGLEVLVLDALRHTPHPTHFSLSQALELIAEVRPRRAILTNMHTDLDYAALGRQLPPNVEPAFDGMRIEVAD